MKKEKIIITGGAGFVGSHLSRKLMELGYEVHIIDNLVSGKKSNVPNGAFFHKADISDFKRIKAFFHNTKYVFHLAALPSVEFSIQNPLISNETNHTGTLNVFKASSDSGVKKLIFASSCSVYGDQSVKKLTEKLTPNPKSPYALQKRIGEEYAKLWNFLYGLDILCLRFFNIYGPGQRNEGPYAFVIAKFLKLKKENRDFQITGNGKQTRDFVHIDDVVDACLKAMQTKTVPADYINIGGGKGVSVNEIAKMIGGKIKYIPARLEPKDAEADNSKALKILGWKPKIELKKGISDLVVNN